MSLAPAAFAGPPATTYTVTVTSDSAVDGACDDGAGGLSLREALCFATGESAAVVSVPAGTFTLSAGPLRVNPSHDVDLTLTGAGAGATVLDAHGASRVLDIDETLRGGVDVTVSGMTLTGGAPRVSDATYGGGAIIAGSGTPGDEDSLTLTDCAVTNSRNLPTTVTSGTADATGGGVQMTGGSLTITGCTFSGNSAVDAAGGAVAFLGTGGTDRLTVDRSAFSANTVTGSAAAGVVGGAALFVYGGAPVTSVTGSGFQQNTATTLSASPAQGAALRVDAGTATVTASAFDGNATTNGVTTAGDAVRGTVPTDSWFGCSAAGAACDQVGGAAPANVVGLTLTATPGIAVQGQSVALDAAFTTPGGDEPDDDLLSALRMLAAPVWSAANGTATGDTVIDATGHVSGTFTVGSTNGQPTVSVAGSSAQASVTRAVPASIVGNPASTTVAEGAVATFTASAAGTPAPDLQWYSAPSGSSTFTALTGKTGGQLTVTADRTLDGTQYLARAWNDFTTWPPGVPTTAATLHVLWGPTVTTDPASTTVAAGADATFTVAASGNPAPTVAWETSPDGTAWTPVPGATSTTYTRTTTAGDDGLRVHAVLTGASTATTTSALLTVHTPPVLAAVADQTVADGAAATFTASVTGNPAATLGWQRRVAGTWTTIPGENGTTLTVDADPALDGAQYRVVASSTLVSGPATATSNTATLHVLWGPTVTTDPVATTVTAGADATFTAAASGNPAPAVQWEESTDAGGSWAPVAGATSTTYTRTAAAGDDGLLVRAVFTGTGTATTASAELSVNDGPAFTDQPDAVTADAGSPVQLTVAVSGNPAPTLQWQVRSGASWTDLPGQTGTTLSLTAAADGEYRAVATNVEGVVPSDPATVTVLTAPTVTDPESVGTHPGGTVSFAVAVTGTPAPDVTWETSPDGTTWTGVPGATGSTLTVSPTLADDGLQVRAVASSTLVAGPAVVRSAPATLTVVELPALVTAPDEAPGGVVSAVEGEPVHLSWVVLASDGTAQWSVSRDGGATWGPPPASFRLGSVTGVAFVQGLRAAAPPATRTAYTADFTPALADDGMLVRLVVTNAGGSSTFGPVTVEVAAAPVVPTPTPTPSATADPGQAATPAPSTAAVAGATPTPTARPAGQRLSSTGLDVWPVVGVALLLVSLGAAAVTAVRRRREA